MNHWPFSNQFQDWVDALDEELGFKMYNKGDYLVFNYVSIMADFKSPDENGISDKERLNRALRFNMRGAIFDAKTHELIRLPLHKFHNVGEGVHNQIDALDWDNFTAFDKLDGSMVAPFRCAGKTISWGTKAGETHMTPDIEEFIENSDIPYLPFAMNLIDTYGLTPIFEFMHPAHRIVIDYGAETKMVLLAIRNMKTGEYISTNVADLCKIPVVNQWDTAKVGAHEFMKHILGLDGQEGVVVKFRDGRWAKIKAEQYCLLHKTRSAIETERYVVESILTETFDDLLPLVPLHVKPALEKYARDFLHVYQEVLTRFESQINHANNVTESRKEFALFPALNPAARSIGFRIMDHPEETVEGLLKDMVIKGCNSEANFREKIRNGIFKDQLPVWDIFRGVEIDEG